MFLEQICSVDLHMNYWMNKTSDIFSIVRFHMMNNEDLIKF